MGKQITGLILFASGYAIFYWSLNILLEAYLGDHGSPMNPAPLSVCLGIKDIGVAAEPDNVRPYGVDLGLG